MGYWIILLFSYALGCNNLALLLAKRRGADLRAGGSGNPGASNATILLGWKAGVLVGLHDILKATAAVLLAKLLFTDLIYGGAAAAIACILGHIYPAHLRFRGGKGFASYFGAVLALDWQFAIGLGLLIVLVTVLTDYIVVGTMSTIFITPVYLGIRNHSLILAALFCIPLAVILWKHWENLIRIYKGTEHGLRSAIRGDNKLK